MNVSCKKRIRWYVYEVKNINGDIIFALVFTRVEVFPYVLAHIPSTDNRKVPFEVIHQCPPCLTYILLTTSGAGDAVY